MMTRAMSRPAMLVSVDERRRRRVEHGLTMAASRVPRASSARCSRPSPCCRSMSDVSTSTAALTMNQGLQTEHVLTKIATKQFQQKNELTEKKKKNQPL